MNDDFVTYELAVKLKEKGFPQDGFIGYDEFRTLCIRDEHSIICASPTISQVLKWLKKEKNIFIAINIGYCYESYEKPFPTNPKMEPILKGYYYGVWDLGNLNDKNARSEYFESDELAAIAGIEYVLNNLI